MHQKQDYSEPSKKSDIYNLGVLFWELASCASPLNSETTGEPFIQIEFLKGVRESLFKQRIKHDPNERQDIDQVISELNSIDPESHYDSDSNDKESEKLDELESEDEFSDCDVTLY
ncbi:16904_t:CDS:2, partial [Funneliformis geosporum]